MRFCMAASNAPLRADTGWLPVQYDSMSNGRMTAGRGCVTSFKLSPNLRKAALPAGGLSAADADIARLDSVMEVAIKSDVGPDVGATT